MQDCHDEWNPPDDDLLNQLPLPPNTILSHVVYRLLDMVDPPKPPPTPPKLPKSLVRASFIGKPFTGKSTTLQRLEAEYGVIVLSVEGVLTKAVEVFHAEKKKYEQQQDTCSRNEDKTEDAPVVVTNDGGEEEKSQNQLVVPAITVEPGSSVDVDVSVSVSGAATATDTPAPTNNNQQQQQPPLTGLSAELDESLTSHQQNEISDEMLQHFSPLAKLGYKAHLAMASGESLDDQTAVEIFVEEIKQLPEGNCWVMDNFPVSLEQAKVRGERD